MDFFKVSDREKKPPVLKRLPDGRWQMQRVFMLTDGSELKTTTFPVSGTAFAYTASVSEKAAVVAAGINPDTFYLIEVSTTGDRSEVYVVYTWEQLHPTAEVQVGKNTFMSGDDGRDTIESNFLQFSSATFVPGIIGTSTPPAPDAAAGVLAGEEIVNDGTLRRIKRTYVQAGLLQTKDSVSNNGALTVRTATYVNQPQATPPVGFTLVDTEIKSPNGLPVYTYTWARGLGRISTKETTRQKGKVKLVTITYLGSDDEATPTGQLIDSDQTDRDGHVLYSRTYAQVVGDGVVSDTKEIKNNGKLVVYQRVRVDTAPTAPVTTIGGTVVLTNSGTREEDGYTIYTYEWAEGYGRISLEENVLMKDKVSVATVRYLDEDHLLPPSGDLLETSSQEQDGVTLYTRTYLVVTDGLISSEVETKNNGKLKVYRRSQIGGVPTAPSATIGGTVVEISTSTRDEKYYTVYTKEWAEGRGRISAESNVLVAGKVYTYVMRFLEEDDGSPPSGDIVTTVESSVQQQDGYTLGSYTYLVILGDGLIADEVEIKNNGRLKIHRRSRIGALPDAPDATIGTLLQVSNSTRDEKYYKLYATEWVEGYGRISLEENVLMKDKVSIQTVRYLDEDNLVAPSGSVLETSEQEQDGVTLYTKTYLVVTDGLISSEVESKNNDKLKVYRRSQIGGPPLAPAATIGGVVVQVSTSMRDEKYYTVYSTEWAEGDGRISLEENVLMKDKVSVATVRYLRADDGSAPSGTVLETSSQEQDGVTLYTKTYLVVTNGLITDEVETKNNGKLKVYRRAQIGSAPTAPAATISGTVTEISASSRDEKYYTVYTKEWAEGVGMISNDTDTKFSGALTLTTQVWLAASGGTAPTALAGEYFRSRDQLDGHDRWTIKGAVGTGTIEDNSQTRYGGKLNIRTILSLNTAVHASGEIDFSQDVRDGYVLYTSRGVSGNGRFSISTSTLQGGAVTRSTIRFINTDDTAKPAGSLTSSETEQQEGYSLITETYTAVPVAGGGVGGYASEEVATRFGGQLTITTRTAYNAVPPSPGGVLIRSETTQGDGFTINTRSWASGSGNIDSEFSLRMNGALRYTTYRSLNVAPTGTAGTLVRAETSDGDGFTLFTYTYVEIVTADLSDETSSRLGGALTITTKRRIGSAPTAPGGAALISARVDEGEGYAIYTRTYASGTGNIDSESSLRLNGALSYTTYRSLNAAPTGTSGTLVRSETSDGDGYTLFTYTYVTVVTAALADEVQTRLGGQLTLTTKRRINSAPSGTGVLVSSRVDEGEGYVLYTSTFASGTGTISTETRTRYNGRLTLTTIRSLNAAPSAPGGDYVTLVSSEISEGDGYSIYTYTWASGSGLIQEGPDGTRTDGSILHVITTLNVDTGGTIPSGSFLANKEVEPGDGFIIYTRQYYKPPDDYTVAGVRVVTKPGVMGADDTGPVPSRAPAITAVTTSIAVTFTTTPSVGTYTPIKGGCVVYESATFTSGEKLRKNSAFGSDYYAAASGASGSGPTYRGEPCTSYAVSISGAPDQHGQVITFGWEAVPYFRSAGTTIYKVTKETGTL